MELLHAKDKNLNILMILHCIKDIYTEIYSHFLIMIRDICFVIVFR
jgi:hypothetical protein